MSRKLAGVEKRWWWRRDGGSGWWQLERENCEVFSGELGAFSDESKGGRRLKGVWVMVSEPWIAWTVAGGGRTEGSSAGEEEEEDGVRPQNLVSFPFKIKALKSPIIFLLGLNLKLKLN